MIKLYNKVFPDDREVDLQTFKDNYLSLMIAKEKIKKEVKAAHMLQGILERCDSEELE